MAIWWTFRAHDPKINSMKISMLITLVIIGIAISLYLKPWQKGALPGADRPGPPPTKRFMKQCATVNSERNKPTDYCRCLWRKGVRSLGDTLVAPSARAAVEACNSTVK